MASGAGETAAKNEDAAENDTPDYGGEAKTRAGRIRAEGEGGRAVAIDYFKATEKYLYNYRSLKANIEILKLEKGEIERSEPKGVSAIRYDMEKTGKTYAFHSAPEEETVSKMAKIESIEERIRSAEYIVRKIEKAVEALPVLEKRIVKLKYLSDEKLTWRQIGEIVHYHPDYCKKQVRARAIQKIAVALFGKEALNIPQIHPDIEEKNVV